MGDDPCAYLAASSSGRQELEAEAWMTDGVNELCPKLPSQPKIGHSEFKRRAFLYTCAFFSHRISKYTLVGFEITYGKHGSVIRL